MPILLINSIPPKLYTKAIRKIRNVATDPFFGDVAVLSRKQVCKVLCHCRLYSDGIYALNKRNQNVMIKAMVKHKDLKVLNHRSIKVL